MPWRWPRSARSPCCSCAAAAASAIIRWRASRRRTPRRPPACSSTSSSTSTPTFSRDDHIAMTDFETIIRDRLTAARAAQVQFLAELVKVPCDNPPGDCQSHAERAAALLEDLGFAVERSEETTSEPQSLLSISSAVFCLKTKNS